MAQGNLYVISAPSGTGKTTLVKSLIQALPSITVSISHTTRAKRPVEVDGVNYHFIDEKEFNRLVDHGDFLEHATVFNHLYGTSRRWVEETLAKGIDVILEIDWQGCVQIQNLISECISIFILPPSIEALKERLIQRNQDKPEIIQQRIADVQDAMAHINNYDYIVLNDNFETALNDLKVIVQAERLLRRHQVNRLSTLVKELKVV